MDDPDLDRIRGLCVLSGALAYKFDATENQGALRQQVGAVRQSRRQNGMLVGFGAAANHCAFYLVSSAAVEAHKDELKTYDASKVIIRDTPAGRTG